MSRGWIYRLLALMSPSTRLGLRLHTILCNLVERRLDGLWMPRYGLIAVEGRLSIWEVPNQTGLVVYMTKASKRKLPKRAHVGATNSNLEESPQRSQLERSIKAKLAMILLLLLLLITSLVEESLYRTLKQVLPSIPFNMKLSTIQREKQTTTARSDGSQLSLPQP